MQKVEVVIPKSVTPPKPNALETAKIGEFFYATRKDDIFHPGRKHLMMKVYITGQMGFVHFHGVVAGSTGWDSVESVVANYYAEAPLPAGTKLNLTI